ncbi:MAG: 2-amino-4-hydroxy-6-hydroxymethyldihydropteridine diphosphokinase [Paracoccus sp. (in: a-proteobacteria)]|nr:2-amino-4-hydroxy-6-hydroxymethyldihydropteridine diphosphokinase [Paracoccus sp. (in: a-proteobacteria)]
MPEPKTKPDCRRKLTLIALGANLSSLAGAPADSLRFALKLINRHDRLLLGPVSRLFASAAFPAGSGPDYVNACAMLETDLSPEALLALLHGIEASMGRSRDGSRWGARGIDIDLLAMGDLVLPDAPTHDLWRELASGEQARVAPDRLILPHPRLQDRAFVLVPLAEIAPGWCHPRLGLSVAEMLDALPAADRAAVRVLLDNRAPTGQVTGFVPSDSNR